MNIDRRAFLVTTGVVAGGMALAVRPAEAASLPAPWGPDGPSGNELTPWIEIAADSTVTIRVPQPESGNGTMTQIAMNVAEELHCAWSDIRVVNALSLIHI